MITEKERTTAFLTFLNGRNDLEDTVAEKLDAILSLMEFSSRMKDYYDIYYLAHKFDFDGAILTEALKKTFTNRSHTFTEQQFNQIMTYDVDDGMQKNGNQGFRIYYDLSACSARGADNWNLPFKRPSKDPQTCAGSG